jgi:hypothetical protein
MMTRGWAALMKIDFALAVGTKEKRKSENIEPLPVGSGVAIPKSGCQGRR